MPLTYLPNEAKLKSLLYISNHELSSDIEVQNKQYEVLKELWDNYILECDYFPYVREFKHEKFGRVYTFNWDLKKLNKEEALKECDRLLEEFMYRNERYLEITKALIDELAKTLRPTSYQLKYVKNFTRYSECWMVHDPELHIKKFKDPIGLTMLIEYVERF